MIDKISEEIRKSLDYSKEDKIIFNGKLIEVNKNNFSSIVKSDSDVKLAFIDGGQAEIITGGNFCLSFIRLFALVFQNNKRVDSIKKEFYLLTRAKYLGNELYYESQIFLSSGEKLVSEEDLFISSMDKTIRSGLERASISKISNMARRFGELALVKIMAEREDIGFVLMDGTLDQTFKNEDKYLNLNEKVCALAKSCNLFTTAGDNPMMLLNRMEKSGCWSYFLEEKTKFVKLHENSKHVFRFTGNEKILASLVGGSKDALFLGYPYGLIAVDQMARISNMEKASLKSRFLLRAENKVIRDYLVSNNAHDILDNLG